MFRRRLKITEKRMSAPYLSLPLFLSLSLSLSLSLFLSLRRMNTHTDSHSLVEGIQREAERVSEIAAGRRTERN